MKPELQEQLILAASKLKAKAIDPDVFRALVNEEIDASDSETVVLPVYGTLGLACTGGPKAA